MIAAFIDGLFRYQFLQNALLTSHFRGNWFIHYFTWDVFDG